MTALATAEALSIRRFHNRLSQDVELWLVGGQPEHDQICVCSIDAMASIRIKSNLSALRSNKVENFMLAFARYKSVREDDCYALPKWVCVAAFEDVRLECDRKPVHELGTWSDDIGVKVPPCLLLCLSKLNLVFPTLLDLSLAKLLLLCVLCRAESTRSLLVLLRTGCDTIDSQVQYFLWLDDVHDFVGVRVDVIKYFLLTLGLWTTILWVRAWMDNTVHIEVEIVNRRRAGGDFIRQTLFRLPDTVSRGSDA